MQKMSKMGNLVKKSNLKKKNTAIKILLFKREKLFLSF